MKIKVFILAFAFLTILGAVKLLTQDEGADGEYSGLRTREGMLLIYNYKDSGFSLEVKANNMEKIPGENIGLVADGKLLQIVPVPVNLFITPAMKETKPDLDILASHMEYEKSYAAEIFGKDTKFTSEEIKDTNGRRWLFWEFDLPKESYDTTSVIIKKQLYVNTMVNNRVLMISSVVTEKDFPETIREFLNETMKSLRENKTPINVEAVRDSLKNAK